MNTYQLWTGVLAAGLLYLGSLAWADEHAERVAIDQVPAAVKTAIARESQGATLKEVHKETEGNMLVYEAEIVKDGQEFEVHIAPDGTVTKREAEEHEDDED